MYGHSKLWILYTWVSFAISAALMLGGIAFLDIGVWERAFLALGTFFLVGACFNLAKVSRDVHEQQRLLNRVEDARTEKLLRDYDLHGTPLTPVVPRAAA